MFRETRLSGAYLIEPELKDDARGFFARVWCEKEFAERGLTARVAQCNISFNRTKGTLRGMHYQTDPYREAKIVLCTKGAAYDVIIDLRPESPTFTEWTASELNSENRRMIYVPEGCAHGFQTLKNDTELCYFMSEFYHRECARGVRWNDPRFAVNWPLSPGCLSHRDANFPDFREG